MTLQSSATQEDKVLNELRRSPFLVALSLIETQRQGSK